MIEYETVAFHGVTEKDKEIANLVKSYIYTDYAKIIAEYRFEIVRSMVYFADKYRSKE